MSKTCNQDNRETVLAASFSDKPEGLSDFAGKWRLTREILQKNGDLFTFDGEAEFCWQQARLVYRESGVVTAPRGATMQAERTYFWEQEQGDQIAVFFDDNRYFHRFSAADPHAEHHCSPDHYKVDYSFAQWPRWESVWQVTGPRKDYRMISRYQPV